MEGSRNVVLGALTLVLCSVVAVGGVGLLTGDVDSRERPNYEAHCDKFFNAHWEFGGVERELANGVQITCERHYDAYVNAWTERTIVVPTYQEEPTEEETPTPEEETPTPVEETTARPR